MLTSKYKTQALIASVEEKLANSFSLIDSNLYQLHERVLNSFLDNNVSATHMLQSTGYGYDDMGRDTLDAVFAQAMEAEDAIVRPQIVSGTHAIAVALQGLLEPGDTLLYATGKPYDTLEEVIGIVEQIGSLISRGVRYKEIGLIDQRSINIEAILAEIEKDASIHVVAFQRSAGYAWRFGLSPEEIGEATKAIHAKRPDIFVFVDNCYGEFASVHEPTYYGVDLMAGSMIKNAGGGIAPTGGYLVGSKIAVEKASYALTAPGIGRHCGSYEQGYRLFYQGLFNAPTVVASSLKTALLFAGVFAELDYPVMPPVDKNRTDIIQSIQFGNREGLLNFCKALQSASPIDGMAVPEPSPMPGYKHEVVMAAGAFVQGSSIELSADGPLCEPYIAYFQGGLNYAHGRLACIHVADQFVK